MTIETALKIAPRTHERWGDLEQLFGPRGARIVEGYPVEPVKGDMPPVYAYTGLASAFRSAGFVEVARRSATRPIMRYTIANRDGSV